MKGKMTKDLGDLVVEYLNLDKVNTPSDFLEKIGVSVTEVYIQEVIINKFPLNLIPQGDLYVFTPREYFRYRKNGSIISSVGTKIEEFTGIGTFDECVNYLSGLANENRKIGKQTSINVLFFNDFSQKKFEERIKHYELKPGIIDLNIPNYEDIKFYVYISTI